MQQNVSIKEKDYQSYARLDSEFHECFILGTENDVFIKLYRNLEPKIATIRNTINLNLSEFNTKESFKMHKKIARITFPLWLYVAVTGVIVFLMISPYYPT